MRNVYAIRNRVESRKFCRMAGKFPSLLYLTVKLQYPFLVQNGAQLSVKMKT